MQKDSVHFSTSDHMTQSQAATQEPQTKSLQCNHCSLIFKSKVYLFEHLNNVHGFDVDAALTDAGLKQHGTNQTKTDDNSSSSEDHLACQHCDFKAFSQDLLNEHEKQCQRKSVNQNGIGNRLIIENPKTQIVVVLKNHKEAEGAKEISSVNPVKSTSKSKCTLNSSKDLKTYKRPLQAITKYLVSSSGFKRKPPVDSEDSLMFVDGTKETLLLQESPSNSSPNSSGVFKLTAKPTIDILKNDSTRFLLSDHLHVANLKSPKPKGPFNVTIPKNVDKRPNNESSEGPPVKKAKSDKDKTKPPEKANDSKQQPSSNMELSFEFSEGEEENNLEDVDVVNSKVYICKHCDFSAVGIRPLSTHYQKNHPHIRYNADYLQDPTDWSATFRCLECPTEFSDVAELKRHYTENHREAPHVFMMQSHDLSLVFKCFLCPFDTDALKALKDHHKEKHPTHKVDNSLMYCRYSATKCHEGSSQLNVCGKLPIPEKTEMSPESAHMPCKEVKKTPSAQHPTSMGAGLALYHCKKCKFSHKSVVVVHVHYQKSHPDEAVTIDKIKQSACDTSHQKSMMPERSPNQSLQSQTNSTTIKNHSDAQKPRNKEKLSKKRIKLILRKPSTPDASKTHSETPKTKKMESAEDGSKGKKSSTKCNQKMSPDMDSLSSSSPNTMFYCQLCSYSSTNIKSVVGHQNAKHSGHKPTDIEAIALYSAEMQTKKLQSQVTPRTQPSDSKTYNQVEICSGKQLQHEKDKETGASVMEGNAYACPENLYYCHKCNMGALTIKGVLNHQNRIHKGINANKEVIIKHTALIRDEIEKSKSQEKDFASRLPLPFIKKEDKDLLFCHYCHYRHSTLHEVLRHYVNRHPGFVVQGEQICLYSSMVYEKIKKSHPKTTANQKAKHASLGKEEEKKKLTKKFGKVSEPPSIGTSQTQRTLKCQRCPYKTQHVYLLRRHIWQIHKANRTVTEVLRMCYKQGIIQTGYHCDMCVFSHEMGEAMYDHYRERHPKRSLSLEYIITRLHVGPKTTKSKRKNQTEGVSDGDVTDDCLPSQIAGQNEAKTYSCKACSFKSDSMSNITQHCRAVHPWSVKEDGSVLDVINSRKSGANRQLEDNEDIPVSFDTYQVPLDIENSPSSSKKAATSSKNIKCNYCPAKFLTQRRLNIHVGLKHQDAVNESFDEHRDKQVQIQTRLHVFKCPYCTYLNTNYQGVLTHCQMRHAGLEPRAESLHVDKEHLNNVEDCLKRKGHGFRLSGYICKSCPRIFATVKKLAKHCEKNHNETVANTVPTKPKAPPKPSGVVKNTQVKIRSNQGSLSKASFLMKQRYAVIQCQHCAYKCTTKIGLGRHLLVYHNNASAAKAQYPLYRCALCSKTYFLKKRLGSHYAKKHGKESFQKYFIPLHKKVNPTSQDCLLAQQRKTNLEASKSSTVTKGGKILVFKCPNCPYVNTNHQGTLTHCQMSHPGFIARADELETEEILVTDMISCTRGANSNRRGFRCKKCPQIHASMKKLRTHCAADHGQTEEMNSEHSVEMKTEKHETFSFQQSVLEAFALKNEISDVSTTDGGLSGHLDTPQNQLNKSKEAPYKCTMCPYTGVYRRYLQSHYKKFHKLDALATCKLLEKYNKIRPSKPSNLLEAQSEETSTVSCKFCPNLMFDSPELLIAHFSTVHNSDRILDFIVLSRGSKNTTGLYTCAHCKKQLNGIRKMCYHLDKHREAENKKAKAAETLDVNMTTTEEKSVKPFEQGELPVLGTVEELAKERVTEVKTMTLTQSPVLSPSKPTALEQPEEDSREAPEQPRDSREDIPTCKQCGRTFMSLKGLRSHERSHAALAAIKKHNLPASVPKHKINKYIIYKSGTTKPFLCSFCSYRTNVMGLWRRHFMKNHKDVLTDPTENEDQDEESAQSDIEAPNSEEWSNFPECDEKPEINKRSLYSEPQDVQRQLNLYNLMAGASSKGTVKEAKLPENSLLHCEVCDFNTGHLSSMRRHYLHRHGKKILRCKDCTFFTCSRKTLDMHIEMVHSTCQSEHSHLRDFSCPFCLYQTKNKNSMIDHIILHREERLVPIEVRRPKLSRYLRGIVFRCHNCTFTSGNAENLRMHMMKHDDIKPYKCRLCFFDCTRLSDLEAHLSDKHQVLRNHELVGQVSLDQQARVGRIPEDEEEPLSDSERHNSHSKVGGEYQKQGKDVKNTDEGRPQSWILDHQYETTKPNAAVQERHEQDAQQERIRFLQDSAREQGVENTGERNVSGVNNADTEIGDCNDPETEKQTKENQGQIKHGDDKGSSVTFTQEKEEAEYRSSCDKIAQTQDETLNMEARVEKDILDNDEGTIPKIHKQADQDRDIKIEENLDEEGRFTLTHNQNNPVNMEAKTNRQENDISAEDSFTFKKHLQTLAANSAQLRINHVESLDVSVTNSKEEQIHAQKNSKEGRDPYGEMPVLENEYLKEEINPLGCGEEEDQNDHHEREQDKKDRMISEDDKDGCTDQTHEEGDGIKDADKPHVPKGPLTVMDEAAKDLCPASTEEKQFSCELCGRNLMNSSELKRHVMRHGL
uniref:zinc finger protein 462-like isoform X2 n=1 Tax=Semicossyphus pulcher TaxID=241346 RepID=UPI0037E8666A